MARIVEGKIPHSLLEELLARLTPPGRDVVVGPAIGEDACAVDPAGDLVVASSDPITFTARNIGYYAVNVNANDIVTMGARPRWFLAALLVPPGTPKSILRCAFDEVDRACTGLGIRLVGGHTEATSTVTRPVVVGTMLGTVSRRKLVRPGRTRPGAPILLTKRLALEGTSIIAAERRAEVVRLLGRRKAAKARNLLFCPGISVVAEAVRATETAPIYAMHDPTEGGLLWGLKELARATGLGLEINLDRVPVFPETEIICRHFGINPLGLIASGSLLIVVSKGHSSAVVKAIQSMGVECTPIGTMGGSGLRGFRAGRRTRLPDLAGDEINKAL
jgi:hydrogenase expression/formation protein HypE